MDDDLHHWNRISSHRLACQIDSETGMSRLGQLIARQLSAGDIVALIGDLGAGKTRLVKAIATSFGVTNDEVNSPTFTLIHEYPGRVLIRHCDTYRLRDPDEFADLGLDELFAEDAIAFVEWADRVEVDLPRDRLVIQITINGPESRSIAISATGSRSNEILSGVSNEVGLIN